MFIKKPGEHFVGEGPHPIHNTPASINFSFPGVATNNWFSQGLRPQGLGFSVLLVQPPGRLRRDWMVDGYLNLWFMEEKDYCKTMFKKEAVR